MVTPPVALAAYTAAAIAKASIMQTGVTAFRFALVGFALPYAFVLHPEILLLSSDFTAIIANILVVLLGIFPLSAAAAGHAFAPLPTYQRVLLLAAALLLFLTPSGDARLFFQGIALLVAGVIAISNYRSAHQD